MRSYHTDAHAGTGRHTPFDTEFRINHGKLNEAAQTMKRGFAKGLREGITLAHAVRMSIDAAEKHDATEDEVVENLVLLLAAWGEHMAANAAVGKDTDR